MSLILLCFNGHIYHICLGDANLKNRCAALSDDLSLGSFSAERRPEFGIHILKSDDWVTFPFAFDVLVSVPFKIYGNNTRVFTYRLVMMKVV